MGIQIESTAHLGAKLEFFEVPDVKNEPMLFSCSLDAADSLGGAMTRRFLDALPEAWLNAADLIIDSRVHMLMPGWFPAIPGYHHDDVPRSTRDGQPNYLDPEYRSEHVMALVNANVAATEFALGAGDFELPKEGIIYERWHREVLVRINLGELAVWRAPDRQLIFFNDRTWHQAIAAEHNGWRWFIRASRNTGRRCTNELRRQVQVYLSHPMQGW